MSTWTSLAAEEPGALPHETAPSGLPRLLSSLPRHGAMSLDAHLNVHGSLPALGRRGRIPGIIDEVERSGLRGRGGAGFPTARKLRAVAAQRRRPIVVVNATEGEPASGKDRAIASLVPHLLLDGAVLAAHALGANLVIVATCDSDRESAEGLLQARTERLAARIDRGPEIQLRSIPAGYLSGQESALLSHLDGGPGLPRFTPPMPFERGLGGRPTLSSNAETFAHLALICRHGAEWFRELGSSAEPGSALVTLSGAVAEDGVFEIEYGTSLRSLIRAAGGLAANPQAALIGGYGGGWIGAGYLADLRLSDEWLAPHGATLGSGVIALLDDTACPVTETARLLRWLAGESAGQCGPCMHGLDALASEFADVVNGSATNPVGRLEHLHAIVRGRGACGHPDGACRLTESALRCFESELLDHARHGPCDRCANPPALPLPALAR